jgi:hypothetical protein
MNRYSTLIKNLSLAGALSQIGCMTAVIAFGALLAGLWVDSRFDTKPIFTVALLLLSIPVNIFLMIRVALSTVAQIKPETGTMQKQESQEDE